MALFRGEGVNRVRQANDAVATLITATFLTADGFKVLRNPKGQKAWADAVAAVVMTDDKDPETVRVMTGPIYDLSATPEVLIARKGSEADRAEAEWDDVETLKAALAADVTLGGAVEDARLEGVEGADLDTNTWIGGGLTVRIRLLFAAPTPAG